MTNYTCRDCGFIVPEDRRLRIASPLSFRPDRVIWKCPKCRGRLLPTPEIPCRLCGSPFVPEEQGQKFCSEDCERRDRAIDAAEQKREEREDDSQNGREDEKHGDR